MANDILIVDDEADIRVLTSGILQDEGHRCRLAANSDDALNNIETRRPDLVLLDIWLQGSRLDGLGILGAVKKHAPSLPVVMMSGHGTIETAVSAIKQGAYEFIEKPFKADRLVLVVERALEAARLKRELEELRLRTDSDDDLIGHSSIMATLRQTIERVAPANSRVLITGPSGSGKEVAARKLHGASPRRKGPFVVVNCATMAPDRVESALFGIEKNDETNGNHQIGFFEAAHNGTLFLDEITDMPVETQGKIVRVLQEQIFSRVGGTARIEVDVRVVAGATRSIQDEIAAGRFREDLYYRLSVVPIEIPPLRNRRDDIPILAQYFMNNVAKHNGQSTRVLANDAIAALQAYNWPGNVRELKNVIERVLILAPGDPAMPIRADMLPGELRGSSAKVPAATGNTEILGLPLREAREMFEREYLISQVRRFNGNISKTASFVGMERSALHRKLKALGVDAETALKGE